MAEPKQNPYYHYYPKQNGHRMVLCPEHGVFEWLFWSTECPMCNHIEVEERRLKYIRDKVDRLYKGRFIINIPYWVERTDSITMICLKHGKFSWKLDDVLRGNASCKYCTDHFVNERANSYIE